MAEPRKNGRAPTALRPVRLERGAVPNAEGSCLAAFGNTRVLVAVSVEDGVPAWRKGRREGWITAEYSMLPRATHERNPRERGQVGGRTQEIQRIIGRSVRAMVDSFAFGEFTLKVDCDVLQADGGTRAASITGGCVAVIDAFDWMVKTKRIASTPVKRRVAAVSIGLVGGEIYADLDYDEDFRAGVDLTVVMSSEGRFVELQGTAEHGSFAREELDWLLAVGARTTAELDRLQRAALGV